MIKTRAATTNPDWRESRRQSAREAIVDAAWELVHEEGLAALSLRDLASRAGITTPTVYAYFESKNAIYDAMFGRAAAEFADRVAEPIGTSEPTAVLVAMAHRFFAFCTTDVARYQLLFQRTIPGFEPSAESYAPAVLALDMTRKNFAVVGITQPRHLDLWTALLTGLVDQQVSNDPGGERWTRLIDEAVTMYLAHCESTRTKRRAAPRLSQTRGARR
jgi:AcrR family transcriptional regulator